MSDSRKAIIIGEHPIRENLMAQFTLQGCDITLSRTMDDNLAKEAWHDIVVLSSFVPDNSVASDAESIRIVDKFCEAARKSSVRPTVHLLLQSRETLSLLNTRDYNDEWHRHIELSAFTTDDVWAQNILCSNSSDAQFRGLDYVPVTYESNRVVHFVVIGTSNLGTSLVEHAALVAHFPNYTRNHALRTRITVIDKDIDEWGKKFISVHKPLMDNSYYRFINTQKQTCDLHRPMYEGNREDFVDVEWEFVNASLHDLVVQDKLQGWADNAEQVMSVAVCHDDDAGNLSDATLLADLLCRRNIPIYVKQSTGAMAGIISQSPRLGELVMIGMQDCGYAITLPLLRMAKRVSYVYDYCYNNNFAAGTEGCITAPSFIDDIDADTCWLDVKKAIKRYSNICNAMTLTTKMRSLGHPSDGSRTFYAITRQETDLIAEVEHNRWSVEELLLGFRPCTDEEQADIEMDISKKADYKQRLIHYDLRAYDDLRADDTGKNANTYDICLSASIPLIVYQEKKGDDA